MWRSLAVVPLLALAPAADSCAAPQVQDGVTYGQAAVEAPDAGRAPLLLDLYTPEKPARRPRPVVIVIHGGGFVKQSRKDPGIVSIAEGLAREGIVAASIDYRLMGQRPVPSPRVAPLLGGLEEGEFSRAVVAAADDTLTAIRFLRHRADRFGIDPSRMGLIGASAGAMTANHVAYVLDDHGVKRPSIRFVGSLWGGVLIRPPQGGRNPAWQLESGEAALFAVHGVNDNRVPVTLSDRLMRRARRQQVSREYHRIPRGGHGYDSSRFFTERVSGDDTAFDRLLDFARSRLRRER